MSIVTKTGDAGTTALMFGRRVPKSHPRVEACGAVDELNAALGLARATAADDFVAGHLPAIQKDLIVLMGELGVLPEDLPRYVRDGYSLVDAGNDGDAGRAGEGNRVAERDFQGLGDAGCNTSFRGAGRGADGLPPGGAARVRVEGIRRAGESRRS